VFLFGTNATDIKNGLFTFQTGFASVAVVCKIPDLIKCQDHTCLNQCCPMAHYCEQIVNPESSRTPDVYNPEDRRIVNEDDLKLFYIYKGLSCAKNFNYDGRKYKFSIYQDGSLEFDGMEFKYDEYCINYVEQIDNITDIPTYWQEAHVCVSDNPCKGDYRQWHCLVDLQLIPALFVISMIFLGLLFCHIWIHQREKLFGCMMLSTILMLFIFYLVLSVVILVGMLKSKVSI
jgi:hypothetical protein